MFIPDPGQRGLGIMVGTNSGLVYSENVHLEKRTSAVLGKQVNPFLVICLNENEVPMCIAKSLFKDL